MQCVAKQVALRAPVCSRARLFVLLMSLTCRPRLVDKTHYLFQMGVTFKCKEKFMVMDEETKV